MAAPDKTDKHVDSAFGKTLGEDDLLAAIDTDSLRTYESENAERATSGPRAEFAHYHRQQLIDAMRTDLNVLAAIAMPQIFQYEFPPLILAAWELLVNGTITPRQFLQIALGIPRGFGKTTLIKLFMLWCILFSNKKFLLIINSSATLAENSVADVFDMLGENNIKTLFGHWILGKEIDTQSLKKFNYQGRGIVVAAIGVGGSLRGMNIKNERPDVMIFDDIQTKEDSESTNISGAIERWMFATAMKARSPHGCLHVFAGNMYPGANSLLKKLKTNPKWIKFIQGAILADGTSLWEDLKPYKQLIEELDNDIAAGHPEIFFSEVLNDTDAQVNTKVDLSTLGIWEWEVYEKPQGKFIIIDPSAGRVGSDNVAIGYFEVYDTWPALRDLINQPLSPKEQIDFAIKMAIKTGTRCIACEAVGFQTTLLYWFEYFAKEYNIQNLSFVEIGTKAKSKAFRITEMLKTLQKKEIILHPSVKSLVVNQIVNYNPLKRDNVDDILDLLAYCIPVLHQYESVILTDDSREMLELAESGYGNSIAEDNFAF